MAGVLFCLFINLSYLRCNRLRLAGRLLNLIRVDRFDFARQLRQARFRELGGSATVSLKRVWQSDQSRLWSPMEPISLIRALVRLLAEMDRPATIANRPTTVYRNPALLSALMRA